MRGPPSRRLHCDCREQYNREREERTGGQSGGREEGWPALLMDNVGVHVLICRWTAALALLSSQSISEETERREIANEMKNVFAILKTEVQSAPSPTDIVEAV